MEHSLTATNTFSNNDASNTNIYTCNYNGCHEPQQIDHILSSDHSLRSGTFDSSASSDHWGITATIRERHGKARGKRHVRKPIGWECNDHIAFNNTVRAVEWEQWPLLVRSCGSVIFRPLHCTFTQMDRPGTTREHRNALDGVFTAMTSSLWGQADHCLWSSAIQKKREEFIGARASSVLSELVCGRTLQPDADVLFTISRYVKGLNEEKFTARENTVLATLLEHMWKVTEQRLRLRIRWIRGHSGDVGNGIADRPRAHAGSSSIDGGDGAHCVDGMKRASPRK